MLVEPLLLQLLLLQLLLLQLLLLQLLLLQLLLLQLLLLQLLLLLRHGELLPDRSCQTLSPSNWKEDRLPTENHNLVFWKPSKI